MKQQPKKARLMALFMAHHVQVISAPLLKKGSMSKRRIFLKEIAHRVPICMSTYYRYMRMSTSNYNDRMEEHARLQNKKAEIELKTLNERRRKKRLAAAMAKYDAESDTAHRRYEAAKLQARPSAAPARTLLVKDAAVVHPDTDSEKSRVAQFESVHLQNGSMTRYPPHLPEPDSGRIGLSEHEAEPADMQLTREQEPAF